MQFQAPVNYSLRSVRKTRFSLTVTFEINVFMQIFFHSVIWEKYHEIGTNICFFCFENGAKIESHGYG